MRSEATIIADAEMINDQRGQVARSADYSYFATMSFSRYLQHHMKNNPPTT